VLVKGERADDRLEGRVSAPTIEAMLEPHLASVEARLVARPHNAAA
jgi:hypothetical protein